MILDDIHLEAPEGMSKGLVGRTAPVGSIKCCATADFPLIPRAEWPDRIADMERNKTRLSDLINDAGVPCLDQNGTNYCHANSPTLAIMALRATQGQPLVVLSPGSIGGPVTGFTNQGAMISDDLQWITDHGCASREFVPANQISKSGWKAGAAENAMLHRATEWWDLGFKDSTMFDRMFTLLLSRVPVCVAYNFWSHAVTVLDPVLVSVCQFGVRFRNSWGNDWPTAGAGGYAVFPEGKGTPDEAYAPRQVTASDL